MCGTDARRAQRHDGIFTLRYTSLKMSVLFHITALENFPIAATVTTYFCITTGTTSDNSNKDSYFKTKDGRTYTEEEFNTVKEAMMDVYKRIKNNDIDFLLDDYEDSELETPNEDDLASDYDDEEEEDE